MSILNRPSDGLLNILIAFVRCLVIHGKMPGEKLLNLCAPSSVVTQKHRERATQTLNRWIELGFLVEEPDRIGIADGYSNGLTKKTLSNRTLAMALREVVLAEHNNQRFWESTKNCSADFTRAVCWMLAQDVFAFQPTTHSVAERQELSQLPKDIAVFTNSTRWDGFKSWASFLGFGLAGRFPTKNVFVIDPTTAIRDVLPRVFGRKSTLTTSAFRDRLADALPVLDGGSFRTKVEETLNTDQWKPSETNELSTSLSRSLLRLHDAKVIQLESRSDAKTMNLLGRTATKRPVSHVILRNS